MSFYHKNGDKMMELFIRLIYNNSNFINLFHLNKENKKNYSFCDQNEDEFNYHEIENALCGKEQN